MSYKPRPRKDQVITTFLPTVPEEEQTAAWRLFHRKYTCRVAQIHTETLEFLEQRPPEGNEYQGAGLAKAREILTVTLSAAAMAEMCAEGATIGLTRFEDAENIYNDIKQHLTDWQQYTLTSIHKRKVPEEDLRILDAFAGVVYVYAREVIMNSHSDLIFANTTLGRLLRGGTSIGGTGLQAFSRFNKQQRAAVEEKARGSVIVPEQHSPVIQSIVDPKVKKTKWGT